MRETEVAAPVVPWLEGQGWDVYQEVCFGNVADIVGRLETSRGKPLIWVIEVKTSLSLSLLDQAIAWTPWAQFVSIAVPRRRRNTGGGRAVRHILNRFKIGLLEIDIASSHVSERLRPGMRRIRNVDSARWNEILVEEQKTAYAAGSRGGYWTPFKGTCRDLVAFVQKNPGCLFRTAVDEIEHHYASAKSAKASLKTLIERGVVAGVALRRDGKELRLFPS